MKFNEEERAMWLEDWRRSRKNAWTYARENGLVPQTFCGWVKRETKNTSGFVEISERIKPKQEQPQEILVEKGEIKIHIPLSVWASDAGAIMDGLRAVL